MTARSRYALGLVAALFAAGVQTGCRPGTPGLESPTAPAAWEARQPSTPAREFYPLDLGNEWTYHRALRIEIEILDGTGNKDVLSFEGTVERDLIGTEEILGQEYVVEQQTLSVNGRPNVVTSWTRFRQDHAGLYAADIATNEPPASAADRTLVSGRASTSEDGSLRAGTSPARSASRDGLNMLVEAAPAVVASSRQFVQRAWRDHVRKLESIHLLLERAGGPSMAESGRPGEILPWEIQMLAYPLHSKASWFIRVEPFVVRSEVEAHEVFDTPAGRFPSYRVRIDNELLEPTDRVVVWYGACGRLGFTVHTETLALDVETGEMALLTSDENEQLTDLSLHGSSRGSSGCER